MIGPDALARAPDLVEGVAKCNWCHCPPAGATWVPMLPFSALTAAIQGTALKKGRMRQNSGYKLTSRHGKLVCRNSLSQLAWGRHTQDGEAVQARLGLLQTTDRAVLTGVRYADR